METTTRLTAHFSGHVQGVGFRYATRAIAVRMPVEGYVQNLRDGRVIMVAEGEREALETLLGEIRSQMGSYIEDVGADWGEPKQEFSGFEIQF
ncbi:MAG: acylphosphatase [Planctomycetota bacterium]